MRRGTALSLSLAMALSGMPAQAFAEAADLLGETPDQSVPGTSADLPGDVVKSGTWGGCPWEIDAAGVLTVHPGEGVDTEGSSPWGEYRDSITKVVFVSDETGDVILPSNSSYLFDGMSQLVSADLSGANSSGVTITRCMFLNCSKLASLDLSGFDTSKASNMGRMFEGCSSLASLDLSGWNTKSAEDMGGMFYGCKSLVSLDLSDWNTSKVKYMGDMFRNCTSLTSLDVSSWNTSKVQDAYWMFSNCALLESLDLSGWKNSSLMSASSMFYYCPKLATIYVGEGWNAEKAYEGSQMFYYCDSLKGSNGTKYSYDHIDSEYARVDAPGTPGYFTLKALVAPAFENANLTVGQQIGLTFWLNLPEADDLDYGDSYVEFTVDDRAGRTERVALTDETPRDEEGRYGFTIDLTLPNRVVMNFVQSGSDCFALKNREDT